MVMHCTGYIKNTPPVGIEAAASSCLVAIARLQVSIYPSSLVFPIQVASMPVCADPSVSSQFSVRIAEDGKMTFIDNRANQLLGLSVDQMIGRPWWSLVHPQDESTLRDAFVTLMRCFI